MCQVLRHGRNDAGLFLSGSTHGRHWQSMAVVCGESCSAGASAVQARGGPSARRRSVSPRGRAWLCVLASPRRS